jgi:preprotein translocase subunit SecG
MVTVLMVMHIILVAALIGVILLQKNEGGALGLGGGSGGGGFMSIRGSANLLTHMTGILAAAFFLSTVILALTVKGSHKTKSIFEEESALSQVPVTQQPLSPPQPTQAKKIPETNEQQPKK